MDKSIQGTICFCDGSSIRYKRKGDIHINCRNVEETLISNVLHLPDIKTNILISGKLDDQGCKTILNGGFITMSGKNGKLLTKKKKTCKYVFDEA